MSSLCESCTNKHIRPKRDKVEHDAFHPCKHCCEDNSMFCGSNYHEVVPDGLVSARVDREDMWAMRIVSDHDNLADLVSNQTTAYSAEDIAEKLLATCGHPAYSSYIISHRQCTTTRYNPVPINSGAELHPPK